MDSKLPIFLYFCVFLKISQPQFNYGSHPYYSIPKKIVNNSPSPPILDQQTAQASNIWSNPPKCSPPTATAYFLPAPPTSPKVTILDTKQPNIKIEPFIKEIHDNIPPPTYPCPFCTGKINVPPKFDVPPPPPSYSVLPGIIEKIPSMMALVEKEDECNCAGRRVTAVDDIIDTSCLLPNTFNYDQELLEGFLKSLGL